MTPAHPWHLYSPHQLWPPAYPLDPIKRQPFVKLCRFRHRSCRKPSRTVSPIGPLYAPRKPPDTDKSAAKAAFT